MTRSTASQRGAQVYRVRFRDRDTWRVTGWAQRAGPSHASGYPSWSMAGAGEGKSPMGLFTATEAKLIATGWNKPMGTTPKLRAEVVKDHQAAGQAAGELQLRHPTGEAA